MAPEQIRGAPVDARADLFAAGVLLYELATGRHPFGGGPVGEILHQILSGPPGPIPPHSEVPAPLRAVILRCLEKSPEARFASATDLLTELQQIARHPADRVVHAGVRPLSTDTAGVTHLESRPASNPGSGAPAGFISDARASGSALWWWAFHQAAVSVFFAAVLVPVWLTFELIPDDRYRLLLRVLAVAVITAAVIVRLHLRFVARVHPLELHRERQQSRRWLALTDWAFSALLLGGALAMMARHPGRATVLLGLAVCYAVVSLIVEPATARAAFSTSYEQSPSAPGRQA
jgi:Protein kinase domain